MIDTTLCNDIMRYAWPCSDSKNSHKCWWCKSLRNRAKVGILNKAHHNQKSRPGGEMADEASTELEQASPAAEVESKEK